MFAAFFKKRAIKKSLARFVSAEVAQDILDGKIKDQPAKFREGLIEFVLVFVRGESPTQISERVGKVAATASAEDAVVHDLVGQLVVIAFGTIDFSKKVAGNRVSLLENLRRELADDIKIVHGSAHGYSGLIGSGTRMSYSFILPRFDAILGTLSRLEFGQVEEFTP